MDMLEIRKLITDNNRYRLIKGRRMTVLVKDDGVKLSYMIVAPDDMAEIGKWRPWADIRNADIPSAAFIIADALMNEHPLKTEENDAIRRQERERGDGREDGGHAG